MTLVRDSQGKRDHGLESADISAPLATGWKPPIPFSSKPATTSTDLYGLMFRPTGSIRRERTRSSTMSIRVPKPGMSVRGRSCSVTQRRPVAGRARVHVIELDGMGRRSGPNISTRPITATWVTTRSRPGGRHARARAALPWIDLARAGIYGHSGGGYATADAMFRLPYFFKVGVSEAGNHDNRVYEDDWGEKWQGLLVRHGDSTNYDNQANQLIAKNLKGHLLLAHGLVGRQRPAL